jgi:hypothetical protein
MGGFSLNTNDTMKTKKQIFYLSKPPDDPYLVKSSLRNEDLEPLILWTVRMYDHILVMPELTLLVQNHYCLN